MPPSYNWYVVNPAGFSPCQPTDKSMWLVNLNWLFLGLAYMHSRGRMTVPEASAESKEDPYVSMVVESKVQRL